ASRRTIERRVGSDNAANTTSKRSGAVTGIAGVLPAVRPADISQTRYLTEHLTTVKEGPGDCEHAPAFGPVPVSGRAGVGDSVELVVERAGPGAAQVQRPGFRVSGDRRWLSAGAGDGLVRAQLAFEVDQWPVGYERAELFRIADLVLGHLAGLDE